MGARNSLCIWFLVVPLRLSRQGVGLGHIGHRRSVGSAVTIDGTVVLHEVDERFSSFAVDSSQVAGTEFWAEDGAEDAEVYIEPYDWTDPRCGPWFQPCRRPCCASVAPMPTILVRPLRGGRIRRRAFEAWWMRPPGTP